MPELNMHQLLAKRMQHNRDVYHARVQSEAEATDAQSTIAGTNLGFDADTQSYRVQVPGGGVVRSQSLTSGALKQGDRVQVSTAKGSLQSYADGMPS